MNITQTIISICFGLGALISFSIAVYCTVIIIQKHINKHRLDKKYGKEEVFHG